MLLVANSTEVLNPLEFETTSIIEAIGLYTPTICTLEVRTLGIGETPDVFWDQNLGLTAFNTSASNTARPMALAHPMLACSTTLKKHTAAWDEEGQVHRLMVAQLKPTTYQWHGMTFSISQYLMIHTRRVFARIVCVR